MEAHGYFDVERIDSIVHAYPRGGFNAQGIIALRTEVISQAPQTPWILFEHPKELAGLTPDAVDALKESYLIFSTLKCCAIALEISTTWKNVIDKQITQDLSIPIFMGKDNKALQDQIANTLRIALA